MVSEVRIITVSLRILRRTNLHSISAMRDLRDIAGLGLRPAKNIIELAMMAHPHATVEIFADDLPELITRMEENGFAVLALED